MMTTTTHQTANVQRGLTIRQAAKLMNVSERSVYMARAVMRLRPDLMMQIEAGTMSVAEAHRIATGKAKATSWNRLVSAWNNATDDDRARLMVEAEMVPMLPETNRGLAAGLYSAFALCGSGDAR